jgi:hypothetical protein
LSRPIMVRSRRESHHGDGITDHKSLQRTSATKSAISRHLVRLFDHLVGGDKQSRRYREAESLGSLEIDH